MTPNQNLCRSYLLELHEAIHNWLTDQFKLALYTPSATLDPASTTAYTAANEVAGVGYVAGGVPLLVTPGYPLLSPAGKVLLDFADIHINPASGFTTRYGLIYNASKANRAVAVLDWGYQYAPAVALDIVWPTPDDNDAIIRLGA